MGDSWRGLSKAVSRYCEHRIQAVHFPRDHAWCIQVQRGLGSRRASQTASQPRRSGISCRIPEWVAQHRQPFSSHIVASCRVIRDTLCDSGVFDNVAVAEIKSDISRLEDYEHPYYDEDLYDRLADRIVEWYHKNPDPIPKKHNPDLRR